MLVPVFEADPTPPRTPWLCWGLAALWLGAFAAGDALPAARFGLAPGAPLAPAALAFFALHTGGVHLAVALALLALSGPALEDRLGRGLFAGFLACAIGGGAAATLALSPALSRPLVGTAAASTALVAAATVRFRRGGIALRIGPGARASATLWLPAFALPVAWLAGFVLVRAADAGTSASAGLALPAQAAAAAGGALCAGVFAALGLEESWRRRRQRAARAREREATLTRAEQALADDRPDAAYALLEEALDADPDARLGEALIEAGAACGRRGDALAHGARRVASVWNAGRREAAAALWCPLVRAEPELALDMRLRLALAPLLNAAGHRREAALTLRGELRGRPRDVTPGAALRIADAARTVHPETAIEAARLALESDALDAGKRARIESLIEALEADPARLAAPELDALPPSAAPAAADGEAEAPPDPAALALPEAPDALDLDTPGGPRAEGDAELEDPYALVLDPEDGEIGPR